MTKDMSINKVIWTVAAVLMVLAAPASAQVSGAIFTTDSGGTVVNGNRFADKCDVYLDGGPGPNAPSGAASLPDGTYYFQVTDPSGKTLLSTDAIANRQLTVTGGLITSSVTHPNNADDDYGPVARVVQLCPFNDTPNKGGVYKVWVTKVSDFGPGAFHGFAPSKSKTDNFKVKRGSVGPCLTVLKFDDQNGNHLKGASEPELFDWPMTVLDPLGTQINGTLYAPFQLCNLAAGTYTVTETLDPPVGNPNHFSRSWVLTYILLDGVYEPPCSGVLGVFCSPTFQVQIKGGTRILIFGNGL